MKTRVIPAQVTTVEDKIAGNLNFTQILLLVASVLIATGIFVLFPKPMSLELYKLPLIIGTFGILGMLAFRVRDRVVLSWVVLLVSYMLRPRIYVFDKNSTFARPICKISKSNSKLTRKPKAVQEAKIPVNKDGLDYFSVARSTNYDIKLNAKGARAVKTL